MSRNGLPSGWATVKIKELTEQRQDRLLPEEYPDWVFIGMDNVEPHTMKLLGTLPSSAVKSSSNHFLPGDLLYGRLRPYLNKVITVDFEGLSSAEFIILPVSKHYSNSFLKYRLNSSDFVSFASHLNEGDRPRVSFSQIGDFEIKLPPFPEQNRIVDKIEEFFSCLDKAEAALRRVQTNLKRYRASVLKAAVEGRLTAEWRKENLPEEPASKLLERILQERRHRWEEKQLAEFERMGKTPPKNWSERYKEPIALDTSNQPPLPEGWCWASGAQIFRWSSGDFLPAKRMNEGDIPVFGGNGIAGYHDKGMIRSAVLVVGRVGVHCGNVHIAEPPAWITDNAIYTTFVPSLISLSYVAYVFQQANFVNRGGAQPFVNQDALMQLLIPLPPQDEQIQISSEVDRIFTQIGSSESITDANMIRSTRLRQSILKKAFEGRLVPQDPADEPAEKLLKRIRQERTTTAGQSARRRVKRKAEAALE